MPELLTVSAAADRAVALCGWTRDAADDAAMVLLRSGEAPDVVGPALAAFAAAFPGPLPWAESLRAFVGECGHVLRRMAARLPDPDALLAAPILADRRLGLGLFEGIGKLRPLRDLVAVLDLPEETAKAISPFAVVGQTRSPGWFLARVVALPEPPPPDLRVGDKVLVEDRCSPDGAGYVPSEELGLPAGGRVVFVPCRRLPTAARSEELAERLKEVQAFKKAYPPEKFPPSHGFWKTGEGEALLAQQGEHAFQMRKIMAERRGCARNRMIKAGKDDVTLPDGIVGVVEGGP